MEKAARDGAAAFLEASATTSEDDERLVVRGWQQQDWELLFSYARALRVPSGHVLIEKHAAERALYFLASGTLEVTTVLGSQSLAPLAKIQAGSVVGELAFFDGRPRSAKVWAVTDSELYEVDFASYQRFADVHPRQACELLFAIGRVVALRLRHSQSSLSQSS